MTIEDPIRVGDKEYKLADMTPVAQRMVTHISTIDKQLNQMDAQMEVLQLAREGCYTRLNTELENADDEQKETGIPEETPDA